MNTRRPMPDRVASVALVRAALSLLVLGAGSGCRSISRGENGARDPVAAAPASPKPAAEGRTADGTKAPFAAAAPAKDARVSTRWKATADVVNGVTLRVDGAAEAAVGTRMLGYLVRTGTEQRLDPSVLKELVALLRSDTAFDDSIVTRCRPGTSVGFRLVRKAEATAAQSEQTVELVLDFGCSRLMLMLTGTGTGTADSEVHTTHFDPSRPAFAALVQRARPDDAELRALR
jgi:hypothetical protein